MHSIQEELYPQSDCFGCGPANLKGLQLRSFRDGDAVIADFKPWPEHGNGTGFLNGGIIATLLDCHSGAAMMLRSIDLAEREPDQDGYLYLTASLEVRYRRPTPMDEVQLRAAVVNSDETKMDIDVELHADGKLRVSGKTHWRRFRPRP
jgi:acyl-coenzyme A thioesterase PaaI-like protein